MMSWRKISFIVFLCSFATVEPDDPCKFEGDSETIMLGYSGLTREHHLEWKCNGKTIFQRRKNRTKPGNEWDVDKDGSLLLKDLKISQHGEYRGQVFDEGGKSLTITKKKVCVVERLYEPQVNFNCKKSTVTCTAKKGGTVTEWKINDKIRQGENKEEIQLDPKQIKSSNGYSCTVRYHFGKVTSKRAPNVCSGTSNPERKSGIPDKLFGLDFWLMVGILAAGGTLLLILVTVLMICVCRRRRQGEKRLRDEEELRLAHLTQQQHAPGHHGHLAHSKGHHGHYAHPHSAGQGQDQGNPPALPKPRAQSRPRPPQPPIEDDQPPPRPQPRKKAPRPPRN
ncbi:T-cell surface antigen CD2-like [Megalops cyprinoides]|uniref:T-cell surface antigen CD2-like n=1 Tax=Megalops cyprinoides TaxID=118141 RepID=UPI0018641788|nr:T-cell surface antigen CD2-like [Megalops cyprinoides]